MYSMEFTWELTKVDWTAVGVWVQALTVVFLVWQIKLSRDQIKVSKEDLLQARKEYEEAKKSAEEARHEAVRPDLVLEKDLFSSNGESADITYLVRNVGVGVARHITLVIGPKGQDGGQVIRIGDMPPESFDRVKVNVGEKEWQLHLKWVSRFGVPFDKKWEVRIMPTGHVHTDDEAGNPIPDAPTYLKSV